MATRLYTPPELAKLLNVSAKTIRESCAAGRIQAYDFGGRKLRHVEDSVR